MLAGAPAALRAFARMRHELRGGDLPPATRERIGLAVAERRGDPYSDRPARQDRAARRASGSTRSRSPGASSRPTPREAALLAFLEGSLEADGRPDNYLVEEAREVGWNDEELLEAVAHLALNEFQSLIANAAALPQDQTDPSILPSAA